MKHIKITPFWDYYLSSKAKWNASGTNKATIEMLAAYSVYIAVGGKKQFNVGDHKFATEKASNVAETLYPKLINICIDYMNWWYAEAMNPGVQTGRDMRAWVGKKFYVLQDFNKKTTMENMKILKDVICVHSADVLGTSAYGDTLQAILTRAEEIFLTGLNEQRIMI